MKCNVGKGDKIIRIVLGLLIIAAGIYYQSWWGAIGLLPIATAVFGFCPAYVPLGITTCKTKNP